VRVCDFEEWGELLVLITCFEGSRVRGRIWNPLYSNFSFSLEGWLAGWLGLLVEKPQNASWLDEQDFAGEER
jgi:hypothetical protein